MGAETFGDVTGRRSVRRARVLLAARRNHRRSAREDDLVADRHLLLALDQRALARQIPQARVHIPAIGLQARRQQHAGTPDAAPEDR